MHEGGYANDPNDLGGPTMWGVSSLMIKRLKLSPRDCGIDADDWGDYTIIQQMPLANSVEFYRKNFWLPIYSQINDQTAATKIYDFAVNADAANAHRVVQRAAGVADDGAFGPGTLAAVNAMGDKFVPAMCAEMVKYYEAIITARPKNETFRKTWMKRAAWCG